jgi:hypothetical protein
MYAGHKLKKRGDRVTMLKEVQAAHPAHHLPSTHPADAATAGLGAGGAHGQ